MYVYETIDRWLTKSLSLVTQHELVDYYKKHPEQDPSNPDNYKDGYGTSSTSGDTPPPPAPQVTDGDDDEQVGNDAKRHKREELGAITA